MRVFIAVGIILYSFQSSAACRDISGKFSGVCQEKFWNPSANKNPELQITIFQKGCESVEVRTKTVPAVGAPLGIGIVDKYDLKNGLTEMARGPARKVITGGVFAQHGFTGVMLYLNNDGTGSTVSFLSDYEVVERAGAKFLLVRQTSSGYQMSCDLPTVP